MRTLLECREELNQIDDQILELFVKRMTCIKDVAEYKIANNLPIFDSNREQAMIERLSANVQEELRPYYVELLKTILKVSKDYQKVLIERQK